MPTDPLPDDPREEVNELKDRVAALSSPVGPAVASATDTAQAYVQQAKETVTEHTETVSAWARTSPIKALLVAAGVGYLVGRVVR